MNRLTKILFISVLAVSLVAPALSLAALPNPSLPVTGAPITLAEIEDRIVQIARFLITMSLIIAVIAIVWGGILWASGGDSKRVDKGKAFVKNGIIGAVIVLAVGVILQTLAGLITRTFFN